MDQDAYQDQLDSFMERATSRPEFGNRWFKWPILDEDTPSTAFDQHYVYHVAWALRCVARLAPPHHVDFSSSLNFCSTVSALVPTRFYDLRPAALHLPGLQCLRADLTAGDFDVGRHPSVSCMHVVEHVGLGRYGDAVDVDGDLKAIANLKKAVAPGGQLLFVVPCGRPAIHFNAHRIYPAASVIGYFADAFDLAEFHFITGIEGEAPLQDPAPEATLDYDYGCGCFRFIRKA